MADENEQTPNEEKPVELPEFRYTASNPIPESPRGRLARAGQLETKGEKPAERPEPEPPRSEIVEPPPERTRPELARPDRQEIPKGANAEEQPRPSGYSILEPAPVSPRGKQAQPGQQDPKGGKQEEEPEPPGYAILEPAPESPRAKLAQPGQQDPKGEKIEDEAEPPRYAIVEPPPPPPQKGFLAGKPGPPAGADATARNPARAPAPGLPPGKKAPSKEIPKAANSPTRIYIWAVVGLGVLFGCVLAVVFSRLPSPDPGHDWGSATSDAAGLKGHLHTKLDKKLEYYLRLEPGDPARRAGFAFAVAHSPRPLSIEIHLQDSQGFVLCSREILLKYDAGSAQAPAASNPEPQAGKADAATVAGTPPSHGMEDLWAAQEAERELGKEVFKDEIGPDGQIAAIEAQGELPCPGKAYGSAYSWSFVPNFPPIAEQDELLKRQEQEQTTAGSPAAEAAPAHKKATRIPAPSLVPFSVEGDDVIVDYDVPRGIIETRAGKTFFLDKTSGGIANPRWQDLPLDVHYRCDQTSSCVLMASGAGALRVRMHR
jgi:hypothetical protein